MALARSLTTVASMTPDASDYTTTLTLYCHEPDCVAFDGTPVEYTEGPTWRRFATLACPHCGRPLHGKPVDERVELTLSDALRAINALLVAADRANTAAELAHTDAYRYRALAQSQALHRAAGRIRASYRLAHATLKNRTRRPE